MREALENCDFAKDAEAETPEIADAVSSALRELIDHEREFNQKKNWKWFYLDVIKLLEKTLENHQSKMQGQFDSL